MTVRGIIIIVAFAVLPGCGQNADACYDYGYSDGYAAGYNTTCEIRATLVKGDWNDKHYSEDTRTVWPTGLLPATLTVERNQID